MTMLLFIYYSACAIFQKLLLKFLSLIVKYAKGGGSWVRLCYVFEMQFWGCFDG